MILALAASLVGALAGAAQGAPVLVLGPHGHVRREEVRYLGPAAPVAGARPAGLVHGRRTKKPPKGPTPASVLVSLRNAGQITGSQYAHYRGDLRQAAGTLGHLHGTRHTELAAVVANLNAIAAAHELTVPRLEPLFLTLERNRQWWAKGSLLADNQRVEFAGSQLVWEYYPGQGLEFQPLGTFGVANGLYTGGSADYPQLESLLGELIPLAVPRAGGLAWEYYFSFDGGRPPWISAMTEGTAMEAFTRGYKASGDSDYLSIAHDILPVLSARPPSGVSLPAPHGLRFLQYSFAPSDSIINAFLQTLIGLHDYVHTSGDPTAEALFAEGDAEAEAEVPSFDTGAWSLYQPGVEDDLSYHELVTGFLQQLCQYTQVPVYCTTAQDFVTDETTPPVLAQKTTSVKAKHAFELRFSLSKISHVGIVITHGTSTLLSTSATFGYGTDTFSVPALKRGTYDVRLAATDLAGNFSRITGTLTVK